MDAAEAVIEEIGDLRTEIMKIRYTTRQEIRSLLTEDQRVWFDSRAGRFWGKQMRGAKKKK
jgi:Spy/CpxP family protein refolding chaperone